MAAASRASTASHKRRNRRRRQDKPAISAKLVLDDHIRSDVGIVSEDLFFDLFPHLEESMLPIGHPEASEHIESRQ